MTNIDAFAKTAAEAAMRGAVDYIAAMGKVEAVRTNGHLTARLVEVLRAQVPGELDQAMADAKEAVDAGMAQVASATFAAAMKLAGIRAAQTVLELDAAVQA